MGRALAGIADPDDLDVVLAGQVEEQVAMPGGIAVDEDAHLLALARRRRAAGNFRRPSAP